MNSQDKKDRFIGALLGTFVGDALGMPYEGWGTTAGPIKMTRGIYTDDTQMMIGVVESLVACGGFDGEDMARRFVENFDPMRAGEQVYAVRDWILLQYNARWVWPNFNIADALLVCGTCLLLVQGFFTTPSQSPPSGPTPTGEN